MCCLEQRDRGEMTVEASQEYTAFVSYRHRPDDRACAEWLVEALESFRTPERLVREGYPVGFQRIFRDDDELRAEPALTPAIRRALWASRYLLVVCSPDTPHSAWVRAEISLFQHWGRGEKIIPVLIGGDPSTSFPPELSRTVVVGEGPEAEFHTEVPRGPSLAPEQGKTEDELRERALLTVAATILGCAFAQLRDRVEERLRKQTSVELFEDVEWRRGTPIGLGPLDDKTAARRNTSWRFESRGGRVMRLVRVNGCGCPAPDDAGVSGIDIRYREDGGVELLTRRNHNGAVKSSERYNADQTIVDFIHEDDSAAPTGGFASGLGFTAVSKESAGRSTILRHLVDYDDAGFVIRRRFCRDTFNTPEADGLGHYGQGF